MILLAFLVLVVSAQSQKLPLRPLGGGTSMGTGKGSINTSEKATPEQKAESQSNERVGTVTKVHFSGPQSGWGITKSATPYYSAEGKRLGVLPGGTLFDYSSVKTSSKNMVLEAKVKQGGDWSGPFMLDCTSLALFEGKPDNVNPEILSNLTEYYSLKSKIAERKATLENAAHEKSPHSVSAQRAQERYAESIAKATELNAKAEKQTGAARTKTHEQLRELKYEQTRLKVEADKEAASYKAWKDANPVAPDALRNDTEIMALENQLAPLKAKIGAIATED
jgi:hypothetical protein